MLINRLWECKKSERLTINANSFKKIAQLDGSDSARCGGPHEKIPPAQGTNQIAGFVKFRPLTNREKDKLKYVQIIQFNSLKW